MIEQKVIEGLTVIGKQVKALCPDVNGQVVFNLSRDEKNTEPKVSIMAADITRAKK